MRRNQPCRLPPAYQRYDNRRHPLLPLDSGFRRNDEGRGRNDEGRPRNIIFVPIVHAGCRSAHEGMKIEGAGWWESFGVISATPATPWIPASAGMTIGGPD